MKKSPSDMADFAKDSTHWYDRSGKPVYQVAGADGRMISPDLRHARKLGLLPGVTGVLKVQSAPGLVNWMLDQALLSALTLPRVEGESLDDFKARAKRDSSETGRKAADRGSELHTALELAVCGKTFDQQFYPHVEAVDNALRAVGVDFLSGDAEHSFAHPLGFGGKNDWHSKRQGVLLDYKSKPRIDGRKLAYDEHIQQLAACAMGLCPASRLLSVFVGIEDRRVEVVPWTPADAAHGWEMFKAALKLWQLKNRYDSAFKPSDATEVKETTAQPATRAAGTTETILRSA